MGIYVFGREMLSQVLTEDSKRRDSSHDFGKDIIPRMVTGGPARLRVPVPGLLGRRRNRRGLLADADGSARRRRRRVDLNDRAWIIHTRSEERPPVSIVNGAIVKDSMITDGCIISAGRPRREEHPLARRLRRAERGDPRVASILTDTWIDAGARVERAIVDKSVRIGRKARVGKAAPGEKPADEPRHHDDRQERGDPGRRHGAARHGHPHRRDARAFHAPRPPPARRGTPQGSRGIRLAERLRSRGRPTSRRRLSLGESRPAARAANRR